ncbi:MAG: arginine biosynthesis protein ArgJ [Verrucomicrobia bacterium]|nr:MAG: arginine biosynthesis protein ArgJ [Verrucomicrobiota bacterium]
MFQYHARIRRDRGFVVKAQGVGERRTGACAPKSFKIIPGSICAPLGFKAAAVFCGIKRRKLDLALIASDVPAAVAGLFTTNQVCAAPVRLSAQRVLKRFAQAIVANSGNANACTGPQGIRDAKRMAEIAAVALNVKASHVLVCSTGRIGVPMPMENVQRGILACAPLLARSATNARQAAEAVMTTDTRRKEIAVEFEIGKAMVRIGGICKGAGMIQPGMATMLAFITSDIAIEPDLLKRALRVAVAKSFNCITVDGDMSTNDSVIMLANGLARNSKFEIRNSQFQGALNFVCLELAKMIVRDGEGVSRFVTVNIHGARTAGEAVAAARAIANSPLVKTSWCGGDPNWGRILCALGYSKATVNESRIDIGYAKPGSREMVFVFRRGRPTDVDLKTLGKISTAREFDLHVHLNLGPANFTMYASDLTEDYVAFNRRYESDPASLGG